MRINSDKHLVKTRLKIWWILWNIGKYVTLRSLVPYPLRNCIWNGSRLDMKADNLLRDCLPLPPTPTNIALPRGISMTRLILKYVKKMKSYGIMVSEEHLGASFSVAQKGDQLVHVFIRTCVYLHMCDMASSNSTKFMLPTSSL